MKVDVNFLFLLAAIAGYFYLMLKSAENDTTNER